MTQKAARSRCTKSQRRIVAQEGRQGGCEPWRWMGGPHAFWRFRILYTRKEIMGLTQAGQAIARLSGLPEVAQYIATWNRSKSGL